MSISYCWDYKNCSDACPVRDMKLLFCWCSFEEEALTGQKKCRHCQYRRILEDAVSPEKAFGPPQSLKLPPGTILAVDDEPNILFAIEETVRQEGFDCIGAIDGKSALAIARLARPRLIISDVIMPKMNGYELCRAIKQDEATKKIPVILVTVRSGEKDRLEGDFVGADAYITKPFSSQELKKKISLFL